MKLKGNVAKWITCWTFSFHLNILHFLGSDLQLSNGESLVDVICVRWTAPMWPFYWTSRQGLICLWKKKETSVITLGKGWCYPTTTLSNTTSPRAIHVPLQASPNAVAKSPLQVSHCNTPDMQHSWFAVSTCIHLHSYSIALRGTIQQCTTLWACPFWLKCYTETRQREFAMRGAFHLRARAFPYAAGRVETGKRRMKKEERKRKL